jgi:regulation of enolase protein 1 (concanavalin A-like superfamily)
MTFLDEDFDASKFDSRLRWFNEPGRWRVDTASSVLVVEPQAGTDFWRKTHYGFEADTGHFLSATVSGDFVMTNKVKFLPVHQYDQAGLMARANESCWIKTSVEYEEDEPPKLGVVVTNAGYSDWSVQNFDRARNELWLRISRKSSDFLVEHSRNGQTWELLRIAHLHIQEPASMDCGLYACSPKGAGFRAEFDLLRIERL